MINKYQVLNGRRVRYVPGWDCHGLPIELKVLQSMDPEQRQALTPIKLRKKAAAYARKQVDGQMKGFQRWGIWADWEQPYLTLQKEYEAAQIKVFGEMVLKGHIYRGLKPVHWSPSSRTALAEAELEHPDGHTRPRVLAAHREQRAGQLVADESQRRAEGVLGQLVEAGRRTRRPRRHSRPSRPNCQIGPA